MTDNQKIAYEWAKSHDYPSIAARYARELAGLVDDLQGAYDAMARDLTARTRQVRQLQGASAALRQQDHFRGVTKMVEPLTLDELRQMDGEPVYSVEITGREEGLFRRDGGFADMYGEFTSDDFMVWDNYGKLWWCYRQKPEEGTV